MAESNLSPEMRDKIKAVAEVAAGARHIVVSTGAGVSAESGVPTFRDASTGLWEKYDPVMLASVDGFRDDPATVWKWYDDRRQNMKKCRPNPGHEAVAEWEKAWGERERQFQVVTQNIDDLHRRAGSEQIIELHGNIWYVRPFEGAMDEAYYYDECPIRQYPLRDKQGRLLRPHVIWFGEVLDPLCLEAAFTAAQECDLMIVAGTSSVVYPAAALPLYAMRGGAAAVEVNPNPTGLTGLMTHALEGASGVILPALFTEVRKLVGRG